MSIGLCSLSLFSCNNVASFQFVIIAKVSFYFYLDYKWTELLKPYGLTVISKWTKNVIK